MSYLQLGERTIRAVVCDVDGTLLDTERLKQLSLLTAAKAYGIDIEPKQLLRFIGISRDQWPELGEELFGMKWDEIKKLRDESFVKYVELHRIPWCAGAKQFLEWLAKVDLPRGRYTSTNRQPMGLLIAGNSALDSYLPEALFGDEIPSGCGKPNPYGYEVMANRLRVPASEVMVLEDSPRGLLAARESGAYTVYMKGLAPFATEDYDLVDLTVDSLEDLKEICESAIQQ